MIDKFTGENRFLSNFYPSEIEWQGKIWPTVEHAYQAAKCWVASEAEEIRKAETPAIAKKLGKHCTLVDNWDEVKIPIMRELLAQKFADPELRDKLLQTGDQKLIEGNHWNDQFWGVCMGKGQNHLGKLLMELRDKINEKEKA